MISFHLSEKIGWWGRDRLDQPKCCIHSSIPMVGIASQLFRLIQKDRGPQSRSYPAASLLKVQREMLRFPGDLRPGSGDQAGCRIDDRSLQRHEHSHYPVSAVQISSTTRRNFFLQNGRPQISSHVQVASAEVVNFSRSSRECRPRCCGRRSCCDPVRRRRRRRRRYPA